MALTLHLKQDNYIFFLFLELVPIFKKVYHFTLVQLVLVFCSHFPIFLLQSPSLSWCEAIISVTFIDMED